MDITTLSIQRKTTFFLAKITLFRSKGIPFLAVILLTMAGSFQGCSTVKPYQKAWLNDANMKLGKLGIDKFDESIHTYREGASGGGNGKTSGGCGCN